VKEKTKWLVGAGEVWIEIFIPLCSLATCILFYVIFTKATATRTIIYVSAILIMSTVTSKKRKALSDDTSEECDRAPAISTNVIFVVLSFVQDTRTTWNSVYSANKEVDKAGM
jgi:hypothetical protein